MQRRADSVAKETCVSAFINAVLLPSLLPLLLRLFDAAGVAMSCFSGAVGQISSRDSPI